MPTRHLNFEGYNPYRNLVNRDPAMNGLAALGASLVAAPGVRSAARKRAFDEEEKKSHDLFDEEYKRDRGRAQDADRAMTHRERAESRRAATEQSKQTFEFHKQMHEDSVEATKARSRDARGSAVLREGQSMRTEEERGRHNREMEGIARTRASRPTAAGAGPKQREAALLAIDMWNKSRIAATSTEMVDGMPVRHVDPVKHQQAYEEMRRLSGRADIPEWKPTAPAAAPAQAAPPPEEPSALTMRRSGRPGVHTVGDLFGGVVDGWSGEQPDTPPPGAGAAGAAGGGPASTGAASADLFGDGMPTHAADASHPAVQQMAKTMASLPQSDQEALKRILMSKDPKRIAAAQDRLMKLASGGAPQGGGSVPPMLRPLGAPAQAAPAAPAEPMAPEEGSLYEGEPDEDQDD